MAHPSFRRSADLPSDRLRRRGIGAQAAVIGTRFLATPEAAAHPLYKAKVVAASEEDTVHTLFLGGGWPDARRR